MSQVSHDYVFKYTTTAALACRSAVIKQLDRRKCCEASNQHHLRHGLLPRRSWWEGVQTCAYQTECLRLHELRVCGDGHQNAETLPFI